MTRRQREAVTSMILEITLEHQCIVWFDGNEVTVQAGHGDLSHAHCQGETLYHRMQKAVWAARDFAADRSANDQPKGVK